jgi:hypothetical protein
MTRLLWSFPCTVPLRTSTRRRSAFSNSVHAPMRKWAGPQDWIRRACDVEAPRHRLRPDEVATSRRRRRRPRSTTCPAAVPGGTCRRTATPGGTPARRRWQCQGARMLGQRVSEVHGPVREVGIGSFCRSRGRPAAACARTDRQGLAPVDLVQGLRADAAAHVRDGRRPGVRSTMRAGRARRVRRGQQRLAEPGARAGTSDRPPAAGSGLGAAASSAARACPRRACLIAARCRRRRGATEEQRRAATARRSGGHGAPHPQGADLGATALMGPDPPSRSRGPAPTRSTASCRRGRCAPCPAETDREPMPTPEGMTVVPRSTGRPPVTGRR